MPELPDVEGFRRELAATLPRQRIRRVTVKDPGILRNTTAKAFARRLAGHRFATPSRHGKWLILPTDGPTVLIHSGMTGHPYYAADAAEGIGHERLVVSLDRGELRYADLRKLRGVWLADNEQDVTHITIQAEFEANVPAPVVVTLVMVIEALLPPVPVPVTEKSLGPNNRLVSVITLVEAGVAVEAVAGK